MNAWKQLLGTGLLGLCATLMGLTDSALAQYNRLPQASDVPAPRSARAPIQNTAPRTSAGSSYSTPASFTPAPSYAAPSPVHQRPAYTTPRAPSAALRAQVQPASHVLPFAEDAQELPMRPMAEPVDGTIQFEQGGGHPHGAVHDEGWHDGGCLGCGQPCGGDDYCDLCAYADPMAGERFHVCSPMSVWNELSVSLGTQAFKGPLDFGRVGNFGFTESINLSDAIWHHQGIGYQFGIRAAQSDFSGDQALGQAFPRTSTRSQFFATTGLFHRAFYGCGWQWGCVVDYLNDRYYIQANMFQVRTELSYVWPRGREFGFTGIVRTQSDGIVLNGQDLFVRSIDQYRLFYRRSFDKGGQCRVWAGGTDQNSALLGADFRLPISNRFDIAGGWNYLIPNVAGNLGGLNEGWGMGLNLIFYPGRSRCGVHNGPYRALFDVADNGTMFSELSTVQ